MPRKGNKLAQKKTADNWGVGSGLIDNFWMTIGSAWFGTDAGYRAGTSTILKLSGEAEIDDEVVDDDHTMFYSCGDGWSAVQNGRAVSHSAGTTKFNRQSNAGKLVQAVLEMPDALAAFKERGYDPTQADAWEGARFRFENKSFKMKDRDTKEEREYDVSLPVEFAGFVEDEEEEAPKKAAASRRKGAAPVGDNPPAATGRRRRGAAATSDNSALRNAVVNFAADWEDDAHSDFVTAVFNPKEFPQAEELQNDQELSNDVLDSDGSIWTASREIVPA